jgi:hypothetical protein
MILTDMNVQYSLQVTIRRVISISTTGALEVQLQTIPQGVGIRRSRSVVTSQFSRHFRAWVGVFVCVFVLGWGKAISKDCGSLLYFHRNPVNL